MKIAGRRKGEGAKSEESSGRRSEGRKEWKRSVGVVLCGGRDGVGCICWLCVVCFWGGGGWKGG